MPYWELLDKARELRDKAGALMDAHAIAPTPANYELWFHYEIGQDHDLKQALDAAVATGRAGDAAVSEDLHQKFCRRTHDAEIEAQASGLDFELRQLAAVLDAAGKGSSDYARTLRLAADQMARTDASSQLRTLIDTVAAATQRMTENAQQLEARVEASTKELDAMRSKMEAVRKESLIDALTGLANRRSFDEALTRALNEANAEGTPLCVLMCDVDHFKKFNDTWGHATGDQVLRLIANCVGTNVKGRDTAARYGGEEIVVILPNTALADATVVAEQIRRTVESRKIVKKSTGESYGSITLSIGGAAFKPGETAAEFLTRADACLYAAKHAGRNRVCTELPDDAALAGAKAKSNTDAGQEQSCAGSVMELSFDDRQTDICVDPETMLADARLKRLHHWWKLAADAGIPPWHESHLNDISFLRDVLHVYAVADEGAEFRVHWVGAELIRVLGQDPTGLVLTATPVQSALLMPSLVRTFEVTRLTALLKSPIRTFSKSTHQFAGGRFRGESLYLPFTSGNSEVAYVLAASILIPAEESIGA